MDKIMNVIRKIRHFCLTPTPDFFIKQQNRSYTTQQIMQSLQQMITGTRFSEERSIKLLIKHLHCILFYACNAQAFDRQIQAFIEKNQLGLIMSTIEVLRLYKSFLKKIVPTNATYFHFLRDSQFYLHYVVVRYVLIVGDSHHLRKISQANVYQKISNQLKRSIFSLLVQWLYDLIEYRNSPIFVKNTTIEYLISNTFILVCGLLGPSYQNTFSSLQKNSQKDLFNKLMFISIYILCDTTSNNKKNKYFLVSMSISCLRKMLIQRNIPDIDIFIPSYFYVDMIGFIHCPLTYEIVLRVLVCFLNEGFERKMKIKRKQQRKNQQNQHHQQKSDESQLSQLSDQPEQQLIFVSPLTEINIWGVINLIIEKYGTYNKTILESFLTKIIPQLQPQSIVRAYCIKLIQQLDLYESNQIIKNFYANSKFDYFIDDRLISVELVIKNFRAFMEAIYSSYVQQAVVEKEVVLTTQNIFKYLLEFNVDEIQILHEKDLKSKEINVQNIQSPQSVKTRRIQRQDGQFDVKDNLIQSPPQQNINKKQNLNQLRQNQKQIQPHHLKQSQFYSKRNSSQIYQQKKFGVEQVRYVDLSNEKEQDIIE